MPEPFVANLTALKLPRTSPVALPKVDAIGKLVQQLDADDYEVREAAESALIAKAGQASDAVYKVLQTGSPEVQRRAAEILNRIPFSTQLTDDVMRLVTDSKITADSGEMKRMAGFLGALTASDGGPLAVKLGSELQSTVKSRDVNTAEKAANALTALGHAGRDALPMLLDVCYGKH